MTLTQTHFCGYCEEPLLLDQTEHYCDARKDYEDYEANWNTHVPFAYSTTALIEAQSFLDKHPEFREHQDLHSYRRVAAHSYFSPENKEYVTPVNFTTEDLPVETNYSTDFDREVEWDGIYEVRDNYQKEQLTYWKDVEPTRCTPAIYWWSNRPGLSQYSGYYNDLGYDYPLYNDPHFATTRIKGKVVQMVGEATYDQRYNYLDFEAKDRYGSSLIHRLEFSELQGFANELLIDANITEKYQYTFLNVFFGRDNHLHCGLLTINTEEHVVKCSRKDCYYRTHFLPIPDATDRPSQEAFTHAIIRHGNNHGPDWYVNRGDFAFIHAENCDTNHDRSEFCNANVELTTPTTETLTGALDFLIRHRKFCRDSRCRCTAYYHTLSHYERELIAA